MASIIHTETGRGSASSYVYRGGLGLYYFAVAYNDGSVDIGLVGPREPRSVAHGLRQMRRAGREARTVAPDVARRFRRLAGI